MLRKLRPQVLKRREIARESFHHHLFRYCVIIQIENRMEK